MMNDASNSTPRTSARRKFFARGLAATLVVAGLGVAAPLTAAEAATARDGVCDAGEFCYYWGKGFSGSVSDFSSSVPNYGTSQPTCYDFRTKGLTGYKSCLKNNAGSVWNRTSKVVRVYYNSGYAGASQSFNPNSAANLNASLYLNNASHKLL